MAVIGQVGARVPTALNPGNLANRKGGCSSLDSLINASGTDSVTLTWSGTASTTALNVSGSGVFQFGCLTSSSGSGSVVRAIVTIDGAVVANDTGTVYYNEGVLSAGNISTYAPANVQYDHYPFNSSLLIVCTNANGNGSYVAKYYLT